jgi:hypothetical protein
VRCEVFPFRHTDSAVCNMNNNNISNKIVWVLIRIDSLKAGWLQELG